MPSEECFFRPVDPVAQRPAVSAGGRLDMTAFRRVRTSGVGNCFYEALSIPLFGSPTVAHVLRLLIARHIKDHWAYFSPFIGNVQKSAYYNFHIKNGQMATDVQIQAAARELQVEIIVQLPNRVENFGSPNGPNKAVIHMLFEGPFHAGHFDALVPIAGLTPVYGAWPGVVSAPEVARRPRVVCTGERPSRGPVPAPDQWQTVGRKGVIRPSCASDSSSSEPDRGVTAETGSQAEQLPNATRDATACDRADGVFFCSCDYAPEEIDDLSSEDWRDPINLAYAENCFPIKIKINGKEVVALLDRHARRSVMSTEACVDLGLMGTVRIMEAKVRKLDGKVVSAAGILRQDIVLSNAVFVPIPMIVADVEPPVTLGQDFLRSSQAVYSVRSDTFTFIYGPGKVVKHRAQQPKK